MTYSTISRHERGYGTRWDKLRKSIIRRDKGLCQHCLVDGLYRNGTDVDHIKRKADGGTDNTDNLQLLCRAHHKAKTSGENGGTEKLAGGCNVNGIPLDHRHHWGDG